MCLYLGRHLYTSTVCIIFSTSILYKHKTVNEIIILYLTSSNIKSGIITIKQAKMCSFVYLRVSREPLGHVFGLCAARQLAWHFRRFSMRSAFLYKLSFDSSSLKHQGERRIYSIKWGCDGSTQLVILCRRQRKCGNDDRKLSHCLWNSSTIYLFDIFITVFVLLALWLLTFSLCYFRCTINIWKAVFVIVYINK